MRWLATLCVWVAGWMLILVSLAQAHQITFSHVDVKLRQSRTTIEMALPVTALTQEEPSSLPAGTGEQALRTKPLAAGVQTALAAVAGRLQVSNDGQPVPLRVETIQPAGDDVAVTLSGPAIAGVLDVRADLFPTDPLHKIFVTVWRAGELSGQYALDRQAPAFTLDAPQRPLWQVVATFVREGVHHIFIGPDHILFVVALVLLGGRLWSQVKIVTAFTVAHSLTLTLAALDLVQLPSRLVESVIALSIVVVGLHDLWRLRRGAPTLTGIDPRMAFAFVFGLVHGFGFAGVLTELDLPRQALAWSLAAFNIGVEIGQATIILLAAPLLWALGRYAPPRVAQATLAAAACGVVVLGAFWFCQRALVA